MNTTVNAPGKNILVVDDDPAARESIKLLLAIDRHTVTEAANGHEALQLFAGSTYDLVITDYLMPGMLGDELAQSIWNIAPEQPVIMLTAYLEKLAKAGKLADTMLGKPFSVDQLRRAIEAPKIRTIPVQSGESNSSTGFSTAQLLKRATATTTVLDEILRCKEPALMTGQWTEKN